MKGKKPPGKKLEGGFSSKKPSFKRGEVSDKEL